MSTAVQRSPNNSIFNLCLIAKEVKQSTLVICFPSGSSYGTERFVKIKKTTFFLGGGGG
jgi:hypothetical protein